MRNQSRSRLNFLSNPLTSLISIFPISCPIIARISTGDLWSNSIKSHANCHALNYDPPLSLCITLSSWIVHRISISHSSRDSLTQLLGKSLFNIYINYYKDFKSDLNPGQTIEFTSYSTLTLPSALIYIPINPSLLVPFRNSFIILQESKGSSSGNEFKKLCNR